MFPRRGFAAAFACLAVLAGCGPTSPTPPATGSPGDAAGLATLAPPPIDLSSVPASVHVEPQRGSASWIGPAGGTLSAVAGDGTTYRLEIPENAVPDATPISMTPISSVDELGLSGGLAGAVYLQPTGLQLAVPATLRITTSRAAPEGTRLAGLAVPHDGAAAELIPAASSGSEITLLVFHFSHQVAAFGTQTDLAKLSQAANSTRLGGLLTTLLAAPVPWDLSTQGAFGLLIDVQWAGSPLVTGGTPNASAAASQQPLVGLRQVILEANSDDELLKAVKDWRTFVFILNLWASSGDAAAAIDAGDTYAGGVRSSHTVAYLDGQIQLAKQFRRAIDGNEALCNQTHDLKALANMWFWAGVGTRYAPGEADWPAEAAGCAALVVATFNPASNLQAGGTDSLQLVFNLEFTDGTRVPADVEANLSGTGFTFAASGGATMAASIAGGTTFTAGVQGSQSPPYTLTATACWLLDGLARNLCGGPYALSFGTGAAPSAAPQGSGASAPPFNLSGTYRISGQSSSAQQCGAQFSFTGAATVVHKGTTVTVQWTFDALTTPDADSCLQGQWNQVTKSGTFSGTLVGDMTIGFRIKGIALQCGGPVAGGEVQVGLSPRKSIVIASDCGLKVFARADFVGP